MSKAHKRKIKKLSSRLRHLRAYVIDISDMHGEYQREWVSDYDLLKTQISGNKDESIRSQSAEGESPSSSPDQMTHDDPDPATPQWAKKLYRQVAMLTHPDRLFDPSDVKSMTKLFNKATDSVHSGDFSGLVDVAIELGLDVDLPDEEVTSRVEKKLEEIENKIFSMENCVAWKWCESDDTLEKVIILKQALSHETHTIPEDEILELLIKSLNEI